MTTIERPSDEMTGKVVAKQFGKNDAHYEWNTHGEDDPYFYTNDVPKGHGSLVLCKDPRDDLDAAMKLLGECVRILETRPGAPGTAWSSCIVDFGCNGWRIGETYPVNWSVHLPISGPGLRYGIVQLAAIVFDVSD